MRPFVCLVEVRLHFGDVRDLKGKRKLVKSLKDQLGATGFGLEIGERWQRRARTGRHEAGGNQRQAGNHAEGRGEEHREEK